MLTNVNHFSLMIKKCKTLDCYSFINKDMNEKYNVYLVSDSTGETLDRIFVSLKSQFANFEYEKKSLLLCELNNKLKKLLWNVIKLRIR